MAESLNKAAGKILRHGIVLLTFASNSALVFGGTLPDPLKPPTSVVNDAHAPIATAAPQLQSIVISSGRRTASINGQSVHVGDKIGDARVISIAENEVVLGRGKELQTLKLFPGVEKQWAAGGAPFKTNKRRP